MSINFNGNMRFGLLMTRAFAKWRETRMSGYCDVCAAGERNFQWRRFPEIITLDLYYMVSMCKGRRESLVDNHIMGDVL